MPNTANQTQAVVYALRRKVAAETLITIAADPEPLGARIGLTAVLHTWGSALTHHPHAHIIVPGGGLSPDGQRWIACRPARPGPLASLPTPLPGKTDRSLRSRTATLLRQSSLPAPPHTLQIPPASSPPN